jgi:putative ABC transport system substrate-binding protein
LPIVAFIHPGSADGSANRSAAFRKGLNEAGYVEGQNVTVEYHWLEGQYDRLPALVADMVRRRVAVIATPANTPGSLAAKAGTATIPIVFGVGEDPVSILGSRFRRRWADELRRRHGGRGSSSRRLYR